MVIPKLIEAVEGEIGVKLNATVGDAHYLWNFGANEGARHSRSRRQLTLQVKMG